MTASRRGTKLYLAGVIGGGIWAATRYTALARILGPQQLGLAALVMLTAQFFDMVADTGGDRFIVQDSRGDTPELMAMIHLVFFCRGMTIAALLAIGAPFLSGLYRAPQLVSALRVLSLYPLVMSFYHFDLRRQQREHDFSSEGISLLVSEPVSFAVLVGIALQTHSFYAASWGLIARACCMVMISHLTARRPFRISYSPVDAGRLARFSAPLLINGLVLFFGGQGDRLIIVRLLGIPAVGLYSAVSLLALYPSSMVVRYFTSTQMSLLAGSRGDDGLLRARTDQIAGSATLAAVAMAGGFALLTPFAIGPLFGSRYDQPAVVICAIGILQISRFVRYWPSVASLSQGRTTPLVAATTIRLAALPLGFIVVGQGGGMVGLMGVFTAGEAAAYLLNLVLFNRDMKWRWSLDTGRIVLFFSFCALILVLCAVLRTPTPARAAVCASAALAGVGIVLWFERTAVAHLLDLARQRVWGRLSSLMTGNAKLRV